MPIQGVEQALTSSGLCLRGGFRPDNRDGVPPFADGSPARTVLMVGNTGPAMWQRFTDKRQAGRSPLDSWTRTVLTRVADQVGGRAVYPFDRPYLPFQRWSMRAEPCHPSPIGMLIHPEFGLWHALRGALLFTREISIPEVARFPSPCDSCQDRPCLTACPATAFSPTNGYDVPRCVGHLGRPAGQDCIDIGCRARRACPVGGSYRYAAEQARFHMEAFLANTGRPG